MILRLIILTLLLSVTFDNYAQGNPSLALKDLFATIQQADSLKFVNFYLTSGELSEILKVAITGSIDTDSLRYKSQINSKEYLHYLTREEFKKITSNAASQKINLFDSKYLDCKYQIIRDPRILFTSLTGAIFFRGGNNNYELKVDEAIYVNETWKIINLGALSLLTDSSVLTKEHTKITAFDSLDIEVKVIDVKLEDVGGQKTPPPPLPPKKPK